MRGIVISKINRYFDTSIGENMYINKMKTLAIGDKVATLPIVQGGMGIGISMANLASSVANEGGIGIISAAGIGMLHETKKTSNKNSVDALKKEIEKAKSQTSGIIGVNIMVALSNYADLVQASIESDIDIIFAGAGLPLDLPKYLSESSKTKIVPIISSGRAARLLTNKWIDKYNYLPDAFVIEGPKAGGHLGLKIDQIDNPDFQLEKLLPEVLDAIRPFEEQFQRKIPVIVGGGIYTGEDIHYFLNHGAAGVQMATRFVTTLECDADNEFKQTYINATKEDIKIIKSPVGLPGRAISNQYLDDVENGLKHPFSCPFDCIITCKKEDAPYCISLALYNAKKGTMNKGFAFAGTNAYLADKIVSVKTLIQTLVTEYHIACKNSTIQDFD